MCGGLWECFCVAAVVNDSGFFSVKVCCMFVLIKDVMDVVFFVCIVRRGAVGARVWMFRHADIVCLCLVFILWQFSMLRSALLAVC